MQFQTLSSFPKPAWPPAPPPTPQKKRLKEIFSISGGKLEDVLSCLSGLALKAVAAGNTILPLRPIMWLPEKIGVLAMMPAYMKNFEAMGLKVLSLFPGNEGTPYDSHQ